MRIAWFTPYGPRSSIGHYSEEILLRLVETDEVTVFAPADEEAARPSPFPVVPLPAEPTDEMIDRLGGYDLVVYNFGNYLRYHLPIYEAAVRHPGVVILHDLVMRDFFLEYFLLHRKDSVGFARLLGYAHGPEAEAHGRDVVEGRTPELLEDPLRLRYALFKPCLHRALGVIVHSEYSRGRVSAVYGGPVRKIDFPIHGPTTQCVDTPPRPRPGEGKLRLLTFGMLNPNKLVHMTVEAIAGSELLRRTARFTAIGALPADYKQRLEGLIARHQLESMVNLTGWQSDDDLRAALVEADVVVNLRNPHLGESSGSLLNSLVAGVATVVWDHGFYGEFPDDVVVKVRSEADLRPALERLAGDPGLRQQIGRAARAHALDRFETGRYCRRFREFAEQVRRTKPILGLADVVSDRLAELGSTDLDGLAARVGAEMAAFAPAAAAEGKAVPAPAPLSRVA